MTRTIVAPRIAVLAYTRRSREQARRILRSLGHAPLVFMQLSEIVAMGESATALDMLVLGDAPELDSNGREVRTALLEALGPDVPVIDAPLQAPRRARRGAAAVDEAGNGDAAVGSIGHRKAAEQVPAGPRFFGDLYKILRTALEAHGFDVRANSLDWGPYAFRPLDNQIEVDGDPVQMDAVSFDVAIELFFNTGAPLTGRWLKQMLPSGVRGTLWHSIDNIACTVADLQAAIRLDGAHGWTLDTPGDDRFQLSRVAEPAQMRAQPSEEPETTA